MVMVMPFFLSGICCNVSAICRKPVVKTAVDFYLHTFKCQVSSSGSMSSVLLRQHVNL